MPKGCVFSHMGPAILTENDNTDELLLLLGILNSSVFLFLVSLRLGLATVGRKHYEVEIIQTTPIPKITNGNDRKQIISLSMQAHYLSSDFAVCDETTHVFGLPILLYQHLSNLSLVEHMRLALGSEAKRKNQMAVLQSKIDVLTSNLYGVSALVVDDFSSLEYQANNPGPDSQGDNDDEDFERASSASVSTTTLACDFLMWCVGVAFGRWDVRYALDPGSLPSLPGPFDPLPVCSPGMLTGSDGLPLASTPDGYPLPVAWDGFLVDDPGHPRDIVSAVRVVFNLLWPGRAEAIEAEACQVLGVPDLRAWLRDPRGFFAYHIKRYSKSRRKAPIYWLLQSARHNYGIWLYYPRLNPDSLFYAGREYADAKFNLESARLEDLQGSLVGLTGSARKVQERKIAAQTALLAELKSFLKALCTSWFPGKKPGAPGRNCCAASTNGAALEDS